MISGQSDTVIVIQRPIFQIYTGLFGFGFKLIIFIFLEKQADVIHRQGATDYKVQGSDFSEVMATSEP